MVSQITCNDSLIGASKSRANRFFRLHFFAPSVAIRANNRTLRLSNSRRFHTQGDSLPAANATKAPVRKLSTGYSTTKECRYRSVSAVENESPLCAEKIARVAGSSFVDGVTQNKAHKAVLKPFKYTRCFKNTRQNFMIGFLRGR